jgi:hypothetical protein
MRYISFFILITLISGCKEVNLNTVSHKNITCFSSGDVGVQYINGKYKCVYGGTGFISSQNKESGCPTEITQIFHSKASGTIETCKGKLLLDGEKTRIINVYK